MPIHKLLERFPRTQKAVSSAASIADYAIFFDNSRSQEQAFTIARIQALEAEVFDIRNEPKPVPYEILNWLKILFPKNTL